MPAQSGRQAGATKSVKELQADFLKLKFGMFIHYNMETYKEVQWDGRLPQILRTSIRAAGSTPTPGPTRRSRRACSMPC